MKPIKQIKDDFIWTILQLCQLYDKRPSEVKDLEQVKSVQELLDKYDEVQGDYTKIKDFLDNADDKTAQEMFEDLGFKYMIDKPFTMLYKKHINDLYPPQQIIFYLNSHYIDVVDMAHISVAVMRAINKQCDELGWKDRDSRYE